MKDNPLFTRVTIVRHRPNGETRAQVDVPRGISARRAARNVFPSTPKKASIEDGSGRQIGREQIVRGFRVIHIKPRKNI